MPANERLGIQLYIEPPKDDATVFLDKLSSQLAIISKALDGVDLNKLSKGGDSAAKAAKAAADETSKLAKETEKAVKHAEALARGIVPTGNNWSAFEKANREAAKAMTTNWQDAQKLMSDAFKKFNDEELSNSKIKNTKKLSDVQETIDKEVSIRKRGLEQIRALELDAAKAVAKSAYTPHALNPTNNDAHILAFNKYQTSQQQANWNQQASTQGVKYQPVDGGFVRSSVQTQNLTADAFSKIRSEADRMNAAIKGADTTTHAFSSTLKSMAARLTEFYSLRTVIFAVGNQFRDATSSAIDMNQAVHDIIAISGGASSEFKGISESIYEIAKSSRFTANEVAELMQVLAQAGIKTAQLADVSSAVGKFATATASDPRLAADVVTTAMNTFKIDATDVTRVTNAMTAALNLSKLETAGLSTAFNYLAPQAAQLGISMEQTLGVIATMAQSGIKASTIGTGVSQMLKEFAAPKKRLKELLDDKGLTADDINPMKRDIADIVQTLQDKKVTVDELFAAMETRVGRAAVTMINLGAPALREMTASLTGTQAALVAYSETMDGARARMNVIKQTFQETAGLLGQHLAPVFVNITESLRGYVTALGVADGKMATAAVSAVALSVGLFAAVKTAGMIAVSLKLVGVNAVTASAAFEGLIVAMKGFSLASLMGPQAIITGILLALGAAIYGVGKWLDHKKAKEEEANRVTLESIANGERLDRTLNAMANSNESVSKAYAKYYKLIKEGKSEEVALKEIAGTKIKTTEDQIKALNDYIRSGGPHAKYLEGLRLEKIELKDLILLERERRGSTNTTIESDALEYTTKRNELRRNRESRIAERDTAALSSDGFGMYNPASPAKLKDIRQASILAEDKYEKDHLQPLYEKLNGRNFTDTKTGMPTQAVRFTGNGDLYFDKIAAPEKPETGKPRRSGSGSGSGNTEKPVDFGKALDEVKQAFGKEAAAAMVQIAKDRAAEAKDMLKEATTQDDHDFIVKAYGDALDEVTRNSMAAAKEKTRETIASKIGATYDRKTNEYLFHGVNATKNRDGYLRNKAGFDAEDAASISAAEGAAASLKAKAINTLPNFTPKVEKGPNTAGAIKTADNVLSTETKIADMQKTRAWTAQEIYKIEERQAANAVKNSEAKKSAYEIEDTHLKAQLVLLKDHPDKLEEIRNKLEANKEAHAAIVALMEEQKQKQIDINNATPLTSFKDGASEAWRQQTDVRAQSKQLGSKLVNITADGTANALSNTFTAAFNPDDEKVNAIKSQINKLRIDKAQLEQDIGAIEANTSKTPQELKALADKKLALQGITSELGTQEKAVRNQTNAWAAFAEGLKGIMKEILKELQAYIAKLIVVAMAQQLAGLLGGAMAGSSNATISGLGTSLQGFATKAEGGPIQKLATGGTVLDGIPGGFLPTDKGFKSGVDSVPILGMPGEFMIKKSSVDHYGRDFFERANAQKLATGGMVGSTSSATSTQGSSKQEFTLQIVNIANPDQIPPQPVNTQQVLNIISYSAAQKGAVYKTIKSVVNG